MPGPVTVPAFYGELRIRVGGAVLGCGDIAFILHVLQHERRPLCRQFRIVGGRIARGGFEQAGQHGRLPQGDLTHGFVEIAFGGCVHPIGAGAQIDPVEIDLQNPVLGEFGFQPQRQQQFTHFAAHGALGLQKEVFGQLLRDGAAALDDLPGADIGDHGAGQPKRVDPEMTVEAPVLGGQHRLDEMGRHGADRNLIAPIGPAPGELIAMHIENGHGGRPGRQFQLAGIRQADRVIGRHAGKAEHQPETAHRRPIEGFAQERKPAAFGLRPRCRFAAAPAPLASCRCGRPPAAC